MEELLRLHFVGANELRKNLTRLLEDLRQEGEELVITKQGKPVAVVVDVEKYLEIQEALREFSDPAYLAELLEAKREFAEGKGIPAEEVYLEKSRGRADEALRLPEVDRLGLVEQLREYVADFGKRSGIQADFVLMGQEQNLPPSVNKNLYAIAHEALINVRRHSGARRVEVRLEFRANEVELSIRDDGRGFQPEAVLGQAETTNRFGLIGMKERTYLLGGRFDLRSAPGQGTFIRIVVPVALPLLHSEPAAPPEAARRRRARP